MRHLLRITAFWALLTFLLSSCREGAESTEEVGEELGERYLVEKGDEESALFGKGVVQYRFDRVESYQGQQCAVFVGTIEILEKGPEFLRKRASSPERLPCRQT
jgi:hypothetical protein